ncbi:MAG: hypothetical protein RL095_4176 [Verrucomicrobiota bacterium]|jgi:serine/threonine protein kinase
MAVKQASTPEIPDELVPDQWPYEADSLLQEGGSKRIWRCRDRRTGRWVARAEMLHPERDAVVFLREARITAHLQHPGIMPVHEIGLRNGSELYFIMKLVDGQDLSQLLDKLRDGDEPLLREATLEWRVQLFTRICEAMAFAHRQGIVHLDLKPANIAVSAYGEVLVCDWGLAKVLDEVCDEPLLLEQSVNSQELNRLTRDGYIKGTPGYMSPEQAGGPFTRKDQRSDIFSLGALLYSLLSFEAPFRGDSLEAVLSATRKAECAPMPKQIPPGLEAICLKAMARRPEDRYQNVGELLDELRAYQSGFAPKAETASFRRQVLLLYRRNRRTCLALAASAAILLTATMVFISNIERARHELEEGQIALKFEMNRSAELGREAAPNFLKKALEAETRENFDVALELATQALSLDPNLKRAWGVRGHSCFLNQDFHASAEGYRRYGNKDFAYATMLVNADYAATLQPPGQALTAAQPVDVLAKTKIHHWIIVNRVVERHMAKQLTLSERLEMVQRLLIMMNPNSQLKSVPFDGRLLDLSQFKNLSWLLALRHFPATALSIADSTINLENLRGMPLEELSLRRCQISDLQPLLRFPKLRRLSLPECKIPDLSLLQNLPIEELDMRGTPLPELTVLGRFASLRRLIVKPGQIDHENCRAILPGVQIIEKP